MNNKKTIMNPTALGWLIVIGIVSLLIGIVIGFSSGIKAGTITALVTFALFGGIEGACLFFSDQSLMKAKPEEQ